MIKIKVSYENEVEKMKVLEMFKKHNVKDIKGPNRKDKYYKMYIFIE